MTNQNKVILFINNLPDNNWTEILIDGQLQSTRDNKFGDIDNDGDVEIVAGAQGALGSEADVAWYENDGSGETWIKHTITSDLKSSRGIDLADFDANDFMDIVVTDFKADELILLLNEDGGQNWTKSIIDNDLKNLNFVYAFDIDLDGDDDIIPSRNAAGALVWYENPHGILFAQTLKVSPFLIQSQTDTLKVRAKVSNPENHPGHIFAVIQGDQSQYIDTLHLFDDGMHSDSDPSDNVWGNSTSVIGLPEDEYLVDLFTYDSTYGDTLDFVTHRFIKLGPVEYEGYTTHPNFICGDTIANPGACLNLKITLRNSSSSAMATNIDARLSSLDSLISIYGVSTHFDDLPAGESRDSRVNLHASDF